MSFCSAPTTHTARKRHRCDWCGELIQPGDRYQRYFWTNGDDAGGTKMHPECLLDSLIEAKDAGPGFEFTPYSQERPKLDLATGGAHG